jgi:hypothetical protein
MPGDRGCVLFVIARNPAKSVNHIVLPPIVSKLKYQTPVVERFGGCAHLPYLWNPSLLTGRSCRHAPLRNVSVMIQHHPFMTRNRRKGNLLTACPDPLHRNASELLHELDICLRLPRQILLHGISKVSHHSGIGGWAYEFLHRRCR